MRPWLAWIVLLLVLVLGCGSWLYVFRTDALPQICSQDSYRRVVGCQTWPSESPEIP